MEVVADAGPLIHLAEINRLPLFQIFDKVHIPNAVWQETVGANRLTKSRLEQSMPLKQHIIPLSNVQEYANLAALGHLHAGEKEALFLCATTKTPTILTDDLAVRTSAKKLGFQPVGSLGIIVRAYHYEQIRLAQAVTSLEALYTTSSLFVTRAIVDLAIEQLHQRT